MCKSIHECVSQAISLIIQVGSEGVDRWIPKGGLPGIAHSLLPSKEAVKSKSNLPRGEKCAACLKRAVQALAAANVEHVIGILLALIINFSAAFVHDSTPLRIEYNVVS